MDRSNNRWSFFAALVFALAGCSATPPSGGARGVTLDELAVSAHATDGSCSTTVVRALTEQLVDEINCMHPGTLGRIDGLPGVSLSTAAGAAPYLDADAARALGRAGERGPGTVSISSALRTLPQQYLLRKWYERRRCGISAAASPGHSNHESGLAIDVSSDQVSSWRPALEAEGFAWFGSRDRVHFEHAGDGAVENLSVLAFQRLWNRNHPEDRIAEDGAYGAQTEARLARAPADGFPIGACSGAMPSLEGGTPMSSDAGARGVDAGSIPSTPDAGITPPPPAGGSLASVHRGLSLAGHEVPRTGLANPYLPGSADIETLGTVTTMDGLSYVGGRVSWFGGPHDTGVTTTETGAVSGERLRALNDPDPADAATVASRPEDFYFLAMRWRYSPASLDLGDVGRDLAWWRAQRLVIVSAATGAAVVVRPVDWGPHPDTGRVADVSHETLRALASTTDDDVLVAFVDPSTPLGPIASSGGGVIEPPPPMCMDVRGACGAPTDCCGGASCRRGVTFPSRCCAEAAMPCASGADCCGTMSCSGGVCQCRVAGRACLDDGDCCSLTCASGSCS